MVLLHYTRMLILFVIVITLNLEINSVEAKHSRCRKLIMKPYFNASLLVGKRWIVFYAWNMNKKFDDTCMDLSFRNATTMIVNRIWNDMYEYLIVQPKWENATLLMFMTPRHEMLLFPDGKSPGKFIGVANVIRSEKTAPSQKHSVPLFNIYMKVLHNGRYLVVSDCNIGVTMLSVRGDMTPFHDTKEVLKIAESLALGNGYPVCSEEGIKRDAVDDTATEGM